MKPNLRAVGSAGKGVGDLPPSDFYRSVHPILTRGADYAHLIITKNPDPDF